MCELVLGIYEYNYIAFAVYKCDFVCVKLHVQIAPLCPLLSELYNFLVSSVEFNVI